MMHLTLARGRLAATSSQRSAAACPPAEAPDTSTLLALARPRDRRSACPGGEGGMDGTVQFKKKGWAWGWKGTSFESR